MIDRGPGVNLFRNEMTGESEIEGVKPFRDTGSLICCSFSQRSAATNMEDKSRKPGRYDL